MKVVLSTALLLTYMLRTAHFGLEVVIEVGFYSCGREGGKRKTVTKRALKIYPEEQTERTQERKNNIQLMCSLNMGRGIPLT